MTQEHHETSVGIQFNSLKRTCASVAFPRSTRSQRERTHISRQHDASAPNYDTPGPIYDVLQPNLSRVNTFSKADQRPHTKLSNSQSSIDLLGVIVDNQNVKFKKCRTALFGTDSREIIRNAAILRYNPQVFYGSESPGPTCYNISDVKNKSGQMISMGSKTKILAAEIQTPDRIGPGAYTIPSSCGGSQFLAQIPNQPVFSFSKARQRIEPSGVSRSHSSPVVRESLILNSIGVQADSTKRSAPSTVIGSQGRAEWKRTALLRFGKDAAKHESRNRIFHPELPSRIELVKWS